MADVRGLRRGLQLHSGITCLRITPLMHINITLNELRNIGLDTCFSSFGQRPREWAVPYRSVLSWRCRRSSFPAPGSSTVCTTQSKRLFPTLTYDYMKRHGCSITTTHIICFRGNTFGDLPYSKGGACEKCGATEVCVDKLCAGTNMMYMYR